MAAATPRPSCRRADPLTGEPVTVLWVKGSGGDLGSMKLDGFATLYLDKLDRLKGLYRGIAHEDEMVGYLPHCTFDLNPRAASIDTPLHAYLPYRHVDHVHPDAVIAIAASARSEELTREVYGDEIGWLPWQRPGFELGLKLEAIATREPAPGRLRAGRARAVHLGRGRQGLLRDHLADHPAAQDWLDANNRIGRVRRAAGARRCPRPSAGASCAACCRGCAGGSAPASPRSAMSTTSPAVLEFVNSNRLEELAALGTSCPDHFLRTKIRPLVVPADADDAALDRLVEGYRQDYAGYYERCRHPDSPAMRDPNAVVYLVPGVGMLTFARDKATARIAAEFYVNAINVMRGAAGVDRYVGLAEQEAFDIEYWLLEEAKLQRLPKPKALAGRVALVTGGAGGIGRRVARRLLAEGACVVLTDIDDEALVEARRVAAQASAATSSTPSAPTSPTRRRSRQALGSTVERFGGIDIVVANAGLATAAAFAETSLADWEKNSAVLAKGVFLVTREAFKVMLEQKLGGSIVTIGSKNALATSRRAPRPTAPPRPPPCTSPAASPSRARRTASAPTWSTPTRSCAARGSGAATGARRAPPAWAWTMPGWRRPTASARCSSAASIPRTSPRPCSSWPARRRPSRPATSSTSTPATRSRSPGEARHGDLPHRGGLPRGRADRGPLIEAEKLAAPLRRQQHGDAGRRLDRSLPPVPRLPPPAMARPRSPVRAYRHDGQSHNVTDPIEA